MTSITLLTNKIAKNSKLSQTSQVEDRQLADRFSAGEAIAVGVSLPEAQTNAPLPPTIAEKTYPIPPYDDPLY